MRVREDNGNPCYNCKNRRTGCHSVCLEYINWKQEWEEKKQKERAERTYVDYEVTRCYRLKRRYGRR